MHSEMPHTAASEDSLYTETCTILEEVTVFVEGS